MSVTCKSKSKSKRNQCNGVCVTPVYSNSKRQYKNPMKKHIIQKYTYCSLPYLRHYIIIKPEREFVEK